MWQYKNTELSIHSKNFYKQCWSLNPKLKLHTAAALDSDACLFIILRYLCANRHVHPGLMCDELHYMDISTTPVSLWIQVFSVPFPQVYKIPDLAIRTAFTNTLLQTAELQASCVLEA